MKINNPKSFPANELGERDSSRRAGKLKKGFTPLEAKCPAACRGDECQNYYIANAGFNAPRELLTGFTLIEVLMVVAIIGILAALGTSSYFGYLKNVEIDAVSREIVSALREAQGRAMAGESGKKWGIHFVNSGDDYYEMFFTATDYTGATVSATTYLRPGVEFASPASGGSLDIIFNRIAGMISATTTVVISSAGGLATTTVTSMGNIY